MKARIRLQAAAMARDGAKSSLDGQVAQVKADVAARGVGGRIADKATDIAVEKMADAIEVADQNRAAIAGTIGALALWFLRKPIARWTERTFDVDLGMTKEQE
ncbi:MAG: hypothetical protein M0R03_19645 [Novosphingobium sp.]|nr:hypothetical protein [Novosphingobium sp.]